MTMTTAMNRDATVEALKDELAATDREWQTIVRRFERPYELVSAMGDRPARIEQLDPPEAIQRLAEARADRRKVRSALATIGEAVPEDADPAAAIWDALEATGRGDDLRLHLENEWRNKTRYALEGFASRQGEIDALTKRGGGSEAVDRVVKLSGEVDHLANRLTTLRYNPAQKQERVDAALEAAGGVPALTDCVRSALQFLGRFENRGEVAAADGAAADTEAALAKIDAKTPLGQALKTRLTEAKATAKAAKTRAAHDAEANLQSLMSRAARADDNALDTIAGLAGEVPDAFPAGFAESLATLEDITEEQLRGALAVIVADHMLD